MAVDTYTIERWCLSLLVSLGLLQLWSALCTVNFEQYHTLFKIDRLSCIRVCSGARCVSWLRSPYLQPCRSILTIHFRIHSITEIPVIMLHLFHTPFWDCSCMGQICKAGRSFWYLLYRDSGISDLDSVYCVIEGSGSQKAWKRPEKRLSYVG